MTHGLKFEIVYSSKRRTPFAEAPLLLPLWPRLLCLVRISIRSVAIRRKSCVPDAKGRGCPKRSCADKAGLDRGTVQALESMKKVPKTDTMALIAEALGISQTEMMAESERSCHQEKLKAYSNRLTSPA